MKSTSLRLTTAVALVMATGAAYAQVPKEQSSDTGKGAVQQRDTAPANKSATPETSKDRSSGAANTVEPKTNRGTAQKTDTQKSETKGTAQRNEAKDNAQKKSADDQGKQQTRANNKAASEKSDKSAPKSAAGPADKTAPAEKNAAGANDRNATKTGSEPKVQLSEQQQTRVRETLLKEKGERVTNVNFSVSVGTRVPRSVHLGVLPQAVVEVVPEYRRYHYVVVRDDIVIVDPDTYVIIAVLPGRAGTANIGTSARLALSDEQRLFILRNVDLKSEARLGIGGISVGMDIPRSAEMREFPSVVVERLPDVRPYRFIVVENQLAIVDPRESKVVMVIENR